jgi:hypothetical protein
MPNWVKNELFVLGPKKARSAVREMLANTSADASAGDSSLLDFNKIVPMPDSYFWTQSPAHPVDKYGNAKVAGNEPLAWQWSKDRNCNFTTDVEARIVDRMRELGFVYRQSKDRGFTDEMELLQAMLSAVLKRIHGLECWHDWCCAKWGTKWNAHGVKVKEANQVLRYEFKTAWRSPRQLVFALGAMCPNVTLVLESSDPDMGWSETTCVRKTHYVWRSNASFPPPATSKLSVGSSAPPESNG